MSLIKNAWYQLQQQKSYLYVFFAIKHAIIRLHYVQRNWHNINLINKFFNISARLRKKVLHPCYTMLKNLKI